MGKSAVVYGIDGDRVMKKYHGDANDVDVERRPFTLLGSHINIVDRLGTMDNGSVILERGKCIRLIVSSLPQAFSLVEKLSWIKDAAVGLQHIHESRIIHADLGCHNMIIVKGPLKFIDFEGCSINGEEASSGYEWFSCQDRTVSASCQTDIFAYGCAMFEIMTGKPPFNELTKTNDRLQIVQQRYAEK